MAKNTGKAIYICGECGYESAKWLGNCPVCSAWNTMVAFSPGKAKASDDVGGNVIATPLSQVQANDALRFSTNIGEFDRVLGGGVVPGSVILLGGDPGIGKSTLLMQTAGKLANNGKVLYVTGEESASQLKLRAQRIGVLSDIYVLSDTMLGNIEAEIMRIKPMAVIIDSIQTIYDTELSGVAGSVTQIRGTTAVLMRLAKTYNIAVFIVGHVTKEGALAGPRMLEHMVDTVLYFEGDRHDSYRLLRAVKNRFGSTDEIGVFEMHDTGMEEIADPSRLFISGSELSGCSITCAIEGTRPMLAEVQALLAPTQFSNPRRMAIGMDSMRLSMVLAVVERKLAVTLSASDIYANVVGGLRINERSCDLAVVMAVLSAKTGRPLPKRTAVIGEISLTGEIRRVSRMDKRIQECVRLGYDRIIAPHTDDIGNSIAGATLLKVRTLADAAAIAGINA